MCCDCVVQVLIKYNMSSSVAPASYVNSYTDCRRMTCCVLNINAHYRIFSAHTLWSKADCIDSVFESAFLERSAAVSTDVATPTPTRSGGQAFNPYVVITSITNFVTPSYPSPGIRTIAFPGRVHPPPAMYV